ncbi:Lar family restriction alleviation protein [Moellerella wisconsensis]|uniref:Lar family restriction alleviation protein n=1 Tax=Moellerella wisconsensis TaxID=158849 RepID=UPI003B215B62
MNELKKCPFCGGSNIGFYNFYSDQNERKRVRFSVVHCGDCPAQVMVEGYKPIAVMAWNRRANSE